MGIGILRNYKILQTLLIHEPTTSELIPLFHKTLNGIPLLLFIQLAI